MRNQALWRPGYDPGDPDTIFLDEAWARARARQLGMRVYDLLTPEYASQVHGINDAHDVGDLAYRLGGRAAKPRRAVVLMGADGCTPIVIPGLGVTEAAELEDVALAAYEKQERKLRAGKPLVDFDALREEEGLPSRKERGDFISQAIVDRIEKHRKNPISDPPREPLRPRGLIPVKKEAEVAC